MAESLFPDDYHIGVDIQCRAENCEDVAWPLAQLKSVELRLVRLPALADALAHRGQELVLIGLRQPGKLLEGFGRNLVQVLPVKEHDLRAACEFGNPAPPPQSPTISIGEVQGHYYFLKPFHCRAAIRASGGEILPAFLQI